MEHIPNIDGETELKRTPVNVGSGQPVETPGFIPSVFEECYTVQQQIAFLARRMDELSGSGVDLSDVWRAIGSMRVDQGHLTGSLAAINERLDSIVAEGVPGPQGPEGPAGPAGKDGARGPQGLQGAQGPAGPAGQDGKDGARGPQGPAGPEGPEGKQGPMGPAGPGGSGDGEPIPGPEGPQGPAGPAGPEGPQGPAGADGRDGKDGVQGPQGLQGPAGADGRDGNDGEPGPPGPEGPAGPPGPGGGGSSGGQVDLYDHPETVAWKRHIFNSLGEVNIGNKWIVSPSLKNPTSKETEGTLIHERSTCIETETHVHLTLHYNTTVSWAGSELNNRFSLQYDPKLVTPLQPVAVSIDSFSTEYAKGLLNLEPSDNLTVVGRGVCDPIYMGHVIFRVSFTKTEPWWFFIEPA